MATGPFDTAAPVDDAATNKYTVAVAAGSKAARFSLDSDDDTADLDLFVYKGGELIALSASGAADEQVTLLAPEAGTYDVYVNGFATPGGATAYHQSNFVVGSASRGQRDGHTQPGQRDERHARHAHGELVRAGPGPAVAGCHLLRRCGGRDAALRRVARGWGENDGRAWRHPCRALPLAPARRVWAGRQSVATLIPRSRAEGARGRTSDRHQTSRGFFVANIKSQLKRIKTNEKARLRNKAVKSSLKTSVRKFREAASAGERDDRPRGDAGRVAPARQGRQQGCHPHQPGREPQVGDGQARRLALGTSRRSAASHEGVTRRGWRPSSSPRPVGTLSRGTGLRRSRPPPAPGRRPGRCRRP